VASKVAPHPTHLLLVYILSALAMSDHSEKHLTKSFNGWIMKFIANTNLIIDLMLKP
jgi:hypothetical protein